MEGYKIRKFFLLKINMPEENYHIGAVKNWGSSIKIKWFKNWRYENINITKCALQFVFFTGKKT